MLSAATLSSQLNPAQWSAVEYTAGPQLVIAGAGSGKTRMLTYKIAYLLLQGIKPWRILALTFTNKAATEMKERIANLLGSDQAQYLHMGTFHSIFARMLRAEAAAVGLNSNFSIYDEHDSQSMLRTIVKDLGLDEKVYKPAIVHKRISLAKNNLIDAARYANDKELRLHDQQQRMPQIYQLYATYCQRCRTANAVDFDDLLLLTERLFRDNDAIRGAWEQRYDYILVDEYQDTNRVQQVILRQLTMTQQHICVVGDDAQSIYAFRGANIDNILSFQQTYPTAKLFKLEQNYRSTKTIVRAANSLIAKNKRQISKEVFSNNADGERLILRHTYSDADEAAYVCKEIGRLQRYEQLSYAHCAILYRTNAQSRSFEEELRKRDIPYHIYGGLSFYQRKEIKDILAYFRLVVNSDDEEALRRVINYPTRGIGATTVAKIIAAAQEQNTSPWHICSNITTAAIDIAKGTKTKIQQFVTMIEAFQARLDTDDAYTLGRTIIAVSGIHADLYATSDADSIARQENLSEFDNALSTFVEGKQEEDHADEAHLTDFLQEVSLQTDLTDDDADNSDHVSLMTVHAAKGLEFATVFIVGLDEGIFPSARVMESLRALEEERRLLYVAITRAQQHCYLTTAKSRRRYGKPEFFVPSRFLNDIDPVLIESNDEPSAQAAAGYRRSRGTARYQNDRPVATQFVADREYKITRAPEPEPPVDPFSPAFRQRWQTARESSSASSATVHRLSAGGDGLAQGLRGGDATAQGVRSGAGGDGMQYGLRGGGGLAQGLRGGDATAQGVRSAAGGDGMQYGLRVGSIIEHQRFGRGTVTALSGTGPDTKATVLFDNVGNKQLLLKFARFTIIA